MPAFPLPLALPQKPLFLQVALRLSWAWAVLSSVLPAFLTDVDGTGLTFLAQFFALNVLLLVHTRRGDSVAYRVWLFLQLACIAVSFDIGAAPAQQGQGSEVFSWLTAALGVLVVIGLGYPLTYQWFADVRTLRATAPAHERLAEARHQQRMALAWGAVAPVTLAMGAGLGGPRVVLVLGAAVVFTVIGLVMVVVQGRRVFKLLRSLS